ncbi:MAG TPA: VTT domain-containing protein [Mycobacteriales bacterium]|nr:VTT domain-containing protein [Mycobacteriales bacterium]
MPVRLAALWLGVVAVLLAVFLAAAALGLPVLADPGPALRSLPAPAGAAAALALLTADVALPVPSSLVMVALGALYGAVPGAALSVAGGALMGLAGGLLGRRGGPVLDRVAGRDRDRVLRLVARWGVAAVVVTRPVPLLAESVVLVAGAARMPLWRLVLGAAAGTLPVAVVYALAGAYGRRADAGAAFVALVLLALLALATGGRARSPRGR